jgi:hypothetical protein
MNLDGRSVLSAAFMRARHADPSLPQALDAALSVIEVAGRTDRFDIERTFDLSLFDPRELADAPAMIPVDRTIFDVLRYALADLRRIDDPLALRNLGYAFHRLPEITRFDRNLYAFSLRFVAFHWALLSEELKLAIARMLEVRRDELEARVTADGFAASMY